MSSDLSYVQYACEQMRGAGDVRFRKMFGEYAVYCDDRVVALVCDNQLFVKPTAAGRAMLGGASEAPPYPGAKPHLLIAEGLEDAQLMANLVRVTASELGKPSPSRRPRPAPGA